MANPISVPVGSTGLRTIGGLNTSGVNTVSGAVTLGTGVTLTEAAGGEVNFTGVVSGAGSITKTGAGTIRLSNTNTFTGATLISGGTLAYGASNALGTGALTINGGVLDMGANRTDSVGAVTLENGSILGTGTSALTSTAGFTVRTGTVSAILAGAVALTKDTAGTVSLSGANTYTGGTNVNVGTLAYGAANALADTGAVSVNGGTLSIGTFSDTVGAVTLASGSILGSGGVLTGTGYALQSGTVTAALGGTGALTKSTAGTVLVSGANTYTGATTIGAGTLRLGATETLPNATSLTMSAGTTLDMSSFSDTIGSLAGTGNLLLGAARLTTGTTTSTTFTGTIGGTGGLTKVGTGTFTLGGSNAYSGSTEVNGGTLALGSATAGPSASRVNVATGATFNLAGFNTTIGSLAGAGSVTLGAGTLATGGDLTSSTFSGVLSGTGGLEKTGTGTLTLTGTNTFSGAMTVSSGTLTLSGTAGRAAAASSVSFRTGALLILDNTAGENLDRIGDSTAINIQAGDLHFISDANGSTETVGALNFLLGPSAITVAHNGSAAQTTALTFSSVGSMVTGTSLTFAATGGTLGADATGPQIFITGQASGLIGSWARVGTDFAEYGTHGVRAYSDYYTGSLGINVHDPAKIVFLSATSPLAASTLTNAGTTNDGGLNVTTLPLVDLGTDATRTLNLTAGGLIKSGVPDTTISGAGRLTANGTAAGALNVGVESGGRLTIASPIIDNAGADGIYGNADDGNVGIVKSGTGTLVLGGANTFSGGVYVNNGFVEVGADAHLGASGNDVFISGGGLRATSSFTAGTGRRFVITAEFTGALDVSSGKTFTITGASDLLGTGSTTSRLVKSGAGDLVLGAANPNFTGTLEIAAGTAELRDADALGTSAQRGSIALNGGTLRLRADASTSFSNPFQLLASSGLEAAPVTTGTPVLSLGAVTIGSQTLTLTATGGAILSLPGAILTGDATFHATVGTTTLGAVSGAYGFTKTGAGILKLTGSGAYSGTTSVPGGTLLLDHAAAIPLASLVSVGAAGTVDLNNLSVNFGAITGTGGIALGSGTLTLGGNLTTSTFGGAISGSGALVKTGSETLTLSGANTYTGATTITAGSIRLGANNALPSTSSIAIAAGAMLDLAGFSQTVTSISGPGTVAIGAGTLTFTDAGSGLVGDFTTTFAGEFTGNGTVMKTGLGKLILSGTSSQTGPITVASGTLELLSASALGAGSDATSVAEGARLTLSSGLAIASEPLTLAGSGPAGAGALELPTGTASWNGPVTLSQAATIGSGGALSLGGAITLAGRELTLTGTGDIAVNAAITGTGTVRKTGGGTLILAGASTFAGTTTVTGGRLRVQDSSALGATGAGNEIEVQTGGMLVLDHAVGIAAPKSLRLAGTGIGGLGAVAVASGDNTLNGVTTLTADATINIAAGSSLVVGEIAGLGLGKNLTKDGAGTLILDGANTFTGTLNVTAGTVSTTSDNRFGGLSGLALAAGATLDLNDFSDSLGALSGAGTVSLGTVGGGTLTIGENGAESSFAGVLTGAGEVVKTGAGTLNLASGSVLTFDTLTVDAGTLNVNSALGTASGTASVTVAENARLKFGSVSQTLSSLTIGAGATVSFSSGLASFSGGGFAAKAPSFGGAAVVPEPGTLGLLLVGALGVLNRRRRQA